MSTSVGKYLYAGPLEQKTHLKSKEIHPSIQGKRHRPTGAKSPTMDHNPGETYPTSAKSPTMDQRAHLVATLQKGEVGGRSG
jgi:hypothetical protein